MGVRDRPQMSTSSAPVRGPKVKNPNAGGGGHGSGKSGGGKGRGRGRDGGAGGPLDFGHWIYDQPSATNGGASSNATFNIVALDVELTNEITGASLATNKVTLPAGTYWVRGMASNDGGTLIRVTLWDDTNSAFLLLGLSIRSSGGGIIFGQIVLAAEVNVELQLYTSTGKATDGMGAAASNSVLEVYGSLEVWKEA